MNIFMTNIDPKIAAKDHCNVHQVKMILEYAQLLSTAHHVFGSGDCIEGIYKKTHVNHPSAIWVRESHHNYSWVWECAMELCRLYTGRTGKVHKTQQLLERLVYSPTGIGYRPFRLPPVAAPEEYKQLASTTTVFNAYQEYLKNKYKDWTTREKPVRVEHMHKPKWL
jgi:hypothetical protein